MSNFHNKNLNFLKSFVKRSHLAVLSILSIVSSVLLISVAFCVKFVIDAFEGADPSNIAIYISVEIVLLLLYAGTFGVNSFLTSRFSMIATKKIVTASHEHLLNAPFDVTQQSHSMEQLKKVASDSEIAVSTYIRLFPTIVSIIVKLVAGVGIMMFISYKITLIAIALGVILALMLLLWKKPIKILHKRAQEKVAISNAFMQEGVKNIEIVKALNISSAMKNGVSERLETVRIALEKKALAVSVINSIAYFVLEIAFLFVLVYGGSLLIVGELTLSLFIVLIGVVEIVKSPLISSTNIGTNIFSMLASLERVMTITNLPQDEFVNLDFDKIVFENVSYSYDDKMVLDNFSLVINKGDKIAIKGISGVGKSTLVKLLIGFIKPTSGNIYLVKDDKKIALDSKILETGYVPQNLQLFNDTILHNIAPIDATPINIVNDALKCSMIYEDVMSLPNGIQTILAEGGKGLSYGQLQRLAIARAIISQKNIIVLDEPFASLDTPTAMKIYDNLLNMNNTIVIISHDEFVGKGTSQVINLGGKIVDAELQNC